MKKSAYIAAIAIQMALTAPALSAQSVIDNALPLSDINIQREDSRFVLRMNLGAAQLHPSSNREFLITPVLVADNGADSAVFTSVLISGRNLYMRHIRNNDLDSVRMYQSGKHQTISYSASVPLHKWMDNATLCIRAQRRGCCDKVAAVYSDDVARVRRPEFVPQFNYLGLTGIDGTEALNAADTVKVFDITGSAYVNFPVNRTELYPQYMNNPAELGKITATIDSVKGDPDITILSISIKGFASPEGPYDNNVRLAKGRTQTLCKYVEDLYKFPQGLIRTYYLPEDWPGLADYVSNSALACRDSLLQIINSDMEPDAKDARIKTLFPTVYTHLLANVYPKLRHSDYIIVYRVRAYTSMNEILTVLKTAPQKLSRYEFYRAAQTMQPGSDEFNEVYETAVRMYPDDEVCNLNAANTAMQRGHLADAVRYLAKAGDSAEAIYARGLLAALREDYRCAETLLSQAARLKVADAPEMLRQVRDMIKYGHGHVEILNN